MGKRPVERGRGTDSPEGALSVMDGDFAVRGRVIGDLGVRGRKRGGGRCAAVCREVGSEAEDEALVEEEALVANNWRLAMVGKEGTGMVGGRAGKAGAEG